MKYHHAVTTQPIKATQWLVALGVLVALVCQASASTLTEAERWREAQIVAIETSGMFVASEALTQKIFDDVGAIREAFPEIGWIDTDYSPIASDRLTVRFTPGVNLEAGLEAIGNLNETFGLIDVQVQPTPGGRGGTPSYGLVLPPPPIQEVDLIFDRVYRSDLLAGIYEAEPLIGKAQGLWPISDLPGIRVSGSEYIFLAGLAGHAVFNVVDGQVTLTERFFIWDVFEPGPIAPEPGSLALIGVGAAILCTTNRRRRQR